MSILSEDLFANTYNDALRITQDTDFPRVSHGDKNVQLIITPPLREGRFAAIFQDNSSHYQLTEHIVEITKINAWKAFLIESYLPDTKDDWRGVAKKVVMWILSFATFGLVTGFGILGATLLGTDKWTVKLVKDIEAAKQFQPKPEPKSSYLDHATNIVFATASAAAVTMATVAGGPVAGAAAGAIINAATSIVSGNGEKK